MSIIIHRFGIIIVNMQDKKRLPGLSVNALFVLILAVTFACKRVPSQPASEHTNKTHSTHNHKKGPLLYIPSSRYICIEYYHNFAIEKVRMSRVAIDGVPSKGYALYILEARVVGRNHETIRQDPDLLGGIIRPFGKGLDDSISSIVFISKNKIIHPKPLHWSDKGERIHCNIYLKRLSKEWYWDISVFYNGDYSHLPLDIKEPSKYSNVSVYEIQNNKDSLYYLVTFDKRHSLPDSVTITFAKKKMKIAVENSTILKYKMKYHSEFEEPRDVVYKRYMEAKAKKRKKYE